jgi:hypothetical protein
MGTDPSDRRVVEWTDAWLAELVTVTEPIYLPQQLQARLVRLLELPGVSGHDWQLQVFEQTIDAVVEFGIGKPALLNAVFAALCRRGGPAQLRALLQSRFLQVVQQATVGTRGPGRGEARSPWLVAREQTTAALFDRSLRALLLQLYRDRGALSNQLSPRAIARAGWRERLLSPALTSTAHDVGGRLDRTRSVIGITMDPAREEIRAHRTPAARLDADGPEVRDAVIERVGKTGALLLRIGDQEIPLDADPHRWSADSLNRWDPDLSRRYRAGDPIPERTPVRRERGR